MFCLLFLLLLLLLRYRRLFMVYFNSNIFVYIYIRYVWQISLFVRITACIYMFTRTLSLEKCWSFFTSSAKAIHKAMLTKFLSLKLVFGCLFVVFIHMGCYNFIAFTYFRNIINIEMKNKKKKKPNKNKVGCFR